MRFKRFTFSLLSPLIGFHVGKNPVSGQRFVHIAPFLFFGIDFNLPPYDLNDAARERLDVDSVDSKSAFDASQFARDIHNDGGGQ